MWLAPHHQGAVEMARIALEHRSDESLKRLARDVIAAQEKEIASCAIGWCAIPCKSGRSG